MNAAGNRLGGAIRRVGGTAILIRGTDRLAFTASVQPRRESGGPDANALGVGEEARFVMFAPAGTAAEQLLPGDSIEFRGGRYFVLCAEAFCFEGAAAYFRAELRREG